MTKTYESAAVVSIGDELLLGEIDNTNATFLCSQMTARGIGVSRCIVLPDEIDEIAGEVGTQSRQNDLVVTCGGIGPTPDDVTRQAIAAACNTQLVLNEEAVDGYTARRGKELNEGQLEMCRLPADCTLIWSKYPSPPAFVISNILVLPGVPDIMKSAWLVFAETLQFSSQYTAAFKTEKGESRWFAIMQDFISRYPSVKIGSYPKMGDKWLVELRIRGSDKSLVDAVAAEFEQAIESGEL